jgi:hypothetical protein
MIWVLANDFPEFLEYCSKKNLTNLDINYIYPVHSDNFKHIVRCMDFIQKLHKRSLRERVVGRIKTGFWPEKFYETSKDMLVLVGTWYNRPDCQEVIDHLKTLGLSDEEEELALNDWIKTLYR